MSLEYSCYVTGRHRLLAGDICRQAKGFSLLIVDPDSQRQIADGRRVPAFAYVWGWKGRDRAEIAAAILDSDERLLAQLTRNNQIGCCELSAIGLEEDPELKPVPRSKPHLEFIGGARLRYDTRSGAASSNLSWPLQRAVCQAIARVAGGLLEDPQAGTFRLVRAMR
jgi:hypothetical protein